MSKSPKYAQIIRPWPGRFGGSAWETIDLIGGPPARMAQAQMGVQAGGLSIRPFQVSRWRLRRARLLWVLNGVLLVGYG